MTGRSAQVARGLNTIAARITTNQDALAEYGIQVEDSNGQLKSTYDVLTELKPKWDDMSEAQRVALGQVLAGQNQYKVLASVMSNMDHAIKATNTAIESQGSAAQENARYMESYAAHLQALKATFQEISTSIINGDGLKNAMDALNKFLKFFTTDIGATIGKTALTIGAVWGAEELLRVSNIVPVLVGQYKNFFGLITGNAPKAAKAIEGVAEATEATATAGGMASSALGWITLIVVAVQGLVALYDAVTVTYEEHLEKLQEINSELSSVQSEYDALSSKEGELTRQEQHRLQLLESQLKALEEQKRVEAEATYKNWGSETIMVRQGRSFTQRDLVDKEIASYQKLSQTWTNSAEDAAKLDGQMADSIQTMIGFVEEIDSMVDAGVKLSAADQQRYAVMNALINAYNSGSEAAEYYAQKLAEGYSPGEIQRMEKYQELLSAEIEANKQNAEAIEEVGEAAWEAANSVDLLRQKMQVEDPGDALEKAQKAYETFAAAMEEGKVGSAEVASMVDLVFSKSELASQFGGSIEAAAEAINTGFTAALLGADSSADALIMVKEKAESLIASGEDIGAVFNADDTFNIDNPIKFAEALGTFPGIIDLIIDGMSEYTPALFMTTEQQLSFIDSLRGQLALLGESGELSTASMDNLVAGISNLIGTSDPVAIRNVYEAIQDVAGLPDLDLEVNQEPFATALTKIQENQQALDTLGETTATPEVDVDNTDALNDINAVESAWDNWTPSTKNLPISKPTGLPASAEGTDYAPGGPTLVNDGKPVHGSPAELIVQDGQAFIANNGQPTVVNLKRGAQVYTAEETYQMTGGMRSGSMPAYATGLRFPTKTSTTTSSSSSYKSSGSSSKSYSSSTSSTPDVATASASTVSDSEALKDWFDDWVKAKKHALAMDEISEADYYRDLEAMNEKYLKNKKDLQDDYWKYQEEIYKWQKSQIEDINELEEKFDALAKARSQKALVYSEGLFQYVQNTEAIAEAERAFKFGALDTENEALLRAIAVGEGIGYSGLGSYSNISGFTGQPTYGTSYGDTFNIGTVNVEEANNVDDIINGIKNVALQTSAKR